MTKSSTLNAKKGKNIKYKLLKLCALFLCVLGSSSLFAQEETSSNNDTLVETNNWQISIAVGLGTVTNPLTSGDNFPLVIAPSINYYGEQVFFDNGTLGYTFVENPDWAFSTIIKPNRNAAYFKRWHPANWLYTGLGLESSVGEPSILPPTSNPEDDKLTPPTVGTTFPFDEVAKRKWSLDAGIQLNWFINDSTHLITQVYSDAMGVHNGYGAMAELSYHAALTPRIAINLSTGFEWLSSKQANYYFGISDRDTTESIFHHSVASSFNPFLKAFTRYQINEKWSAVASVKYNFLDDNIYRSPLINDKSQSTLFIGARYAF